MESGTKEKEARNQIRKGERGDETTTEERGVERGREDEGPRKVTLSLVSGEGKSRARGNNNETATCAERAFTYYIPPSVRRITHNGGSINVDLVDKLNKKEEAATRA